MKDEQKKNLLGKLKLNQLSKNEKLQKNEMKVLKGGCDPYTYRGGGSCTCPNTAYNRDNGGSNSQS